MPDQVTVQATVGQAEDEACCGVIFSTVDVMHWFGRKGRVPVVVTINSYTFRSVLAPMGGCHILPLDAEARAGAHIAGGDKISIFLRVQTTATVGTTDAPANLTSSVS